LKDSKLVQAVIKVSWSRVLRQWFVMQETQDAALEDTAQVRENDY